VYLYRDPVEVLASQFKHGNEPPCSRGHNQRETKRLFPNGPQSVSNMKYCAVGDALLRLCSQSSLQARSLSTHALLSPFVYLSVLSASFVFSFSRPPKSRHTLPPSSSLGRCLVHRGTCARTASLCLVRHHSTSAAYRRRS
jgi:hypothetical protein